MGKLGTQNTGKVEHVGFTITWLGKWLAKSCIARCIVERRLVESSEENNALHQLHQVEKAS